MRQFFESIKPLFGGGLNQYQVDGINSILAACGDVPIEHKAYILATAYHETGRLMRPIKETVASHHKDKSPSDQTVVNRLDAAYAKGQLKWVSSPYWRFDQTGRAWFGRGYVQLSHKSNYIHAAQKLNVPMDDEPNVALQPTVAALVLVRGMQEGWFTGKKLSDYLPGDYVSARRIVNGTDRAAQIAAHARKFEAALGDAKPVGDAKPTLLETILTILRSIFK